MEEFTPEPPFVAIPTYIAEDEISGISQCFVGTSGVQVIYGDKLPTMHLGPPVEPAAVGEFFAWIVEFGPDLIRGITTWALATYAGKKFVDGFAGEAGKDLWIGVKALGKWLFERAKKGESKYEKKAPILNLSAHGAPDEGQPFYLVNISFSVQPENIYDEVEQSLFPFIACVSHDAKAVTLWITQEDNPIWPWAISDFHNRTIYRVNIQQGRFMNTSGAPPGGTKIPKGVLRSLDCRRQTGERLIRNSKNAIFRSGFLPALKPRVSHGYISPAAHTYNLFRPIVSSPSLIFV